MKIVAEPTKKRMTTMAVVILCILFTICFMEPAAAIELSSCTPTSDIMDTFPVSQSARYTVVDIDSSWRLAHVDPLQTDRVSSNPDPVLRNLSALVAVTYVPSSSHTDSSRFELWGVAVGDMHNRSSLSHTLLFTAYSRVTLGTVFSASVVAQPTTGELLLYAVGSRVDSQQYNSGDEYVCGMKLGSLPTPHTALIDGSSETTSSPRRMLCSTLHNTLSVDAATASFVFHRASSRLFSFFGASKVDALKADATTSASSLLVPGSVLNLAPHISIAGQTATGSVLERDPAKGGSYWLDLPSVSSSGSITKRTEPGCSQTSSASMVCIGGFSANSPHQPLTSMVYFDPTSLSCNEALSALRCTGGAWTDSTPILSITGPSNIGGVSLALSPPSMGSTLFAALGRTHLNTAAEGASNGCWALASTSGATSFVSQVSLAEAASNAAVRNALYQPSGTIHVVRMSTNADKYFLLVLQPSTPLSTNLLSVYAMEIAMNTGNTAAQLQPSTATALLLEDRAQEPFPSHSLWGFSAAPVYNGKLILFGAHHQSLSGLDTMSTAAYYVREHATPSSPSATLKWQSISAFGSESTSSSVAFRLMSSCVAIDDREGIATTATSAIENGPMIVCLGGLVLNHREGILSSSSEVVQCLPPTAPPAAGQSTVEVKTGDAMDIGLYCKPITFAGTTTAQKTMTPRVLHSCIQKPQSPTVLCAGGVFMPSVSVTFNGAQYTAPLLASGFSGGSSAGFLPRADVWAYDVDTTRWRLLPGALHTSLFQPLMFFPPKTSAFSGDLLITGGTHDFLSPSSAKNNANASTRGHTVTYVSSSTNSVHTTTISVPSSTTSSTTLKALLYDDHVRHYSKVSSGQILVHDASEGTLSIVTMTAAEGSSDVSFSRVIQNSAVGLVLMRQSLPVVATSGGHSRSQLVERAVLVAASSFYVLGGHLLYFPPAKTSQDNPFAPPTRPAVWRCDPSTCNAPAAVAYDCTTCGPFRDHDSTTRTCTPTQAPPTLRNLLPPVTQTSLGTSTALTMSHNDSTINAASNIIAAQAAKRTPPSPTVIYFQSSGLDTWMSDSMLTWIPSYGTQAAVAGLIFLFFFAVCFCGCCQYASRRRVLRRHPKEKVAKWNNAFRFVSADGVTVTVNELERCLQDLFPKPEPNSDDDEFETSSEEEEDLSGTMAAVNEGLEHVPGYAIGKKHKQGRMTGLRELFLLFDRQGLGYLDLIQFIQCCEYIEAVVAEEKRYRLEKKEYKQVVVTEKAANNTGDSSSSPPPNPDKYIQNQTFDISVDDYDENEERREKIVDVKKRMKRKLQGEQVRRRRKKKEGDDIRRIYPGSKAGRWGLYHADLYTTSHTAGLRVGEPLRYTRTPIGGCWTLLVIISVLLAWGFLGIEHFAEKVPSRSLRPLHDAPPTALSTTDSLEKVMSIGDIKVVFTTWPPLASVATSNTYCLNVEQQSFPQQASDTLKQSVFSPVAPGLAFWSLSCNSDEERTQLTMFCPGCNISLPAALQNPLEEIKLRFTPASANDWPLRVSLDITTNVGIAGLQSTSHMVVTAPTGWRLVGPLPIQAAIVPQAIDVHHTPVWPLLPTSTGAEPGWIRVGNATLEQNDPQTGRVSFDGVDLTLLLNLSIFSEAVGGNRRVPMLYETRTSPQRTNAQLGGMLLGVLAGAVGIGLLLVRCTEASFVSVGTVTSAAQKRKAERVFHVIRDKYGDGDDDEEEEPIDPRRAAREGDSLDIDEMES